MDGSKGLFISGKYAYVTGESSDSLAVVDISNPSSPQVVSYVNDISINGASDVFISGKYAYVTGRDNDSLAIINIYGAELISLDVGNIKTGSLDVSDYALFGEGIGVKNGITGDGLFINGYASIGNLSVNGFLIDGIKILSSISGFSSFTALDRLYIGGLDWDFQNTKLFNTIFGKIGTAPATPLDGQVWYDDLGLNAFVNNRTSHFTPENIVYVHSIADFPPKQADGYIHLEEKHYIIMEQVILEGSLGYKGFYFEKDLSPQITGFRTIGYEEQNPFADAMFRSDDLGGGLILFNNLNVYSEGSGRLFKINSSDGTGFLVLNTFAVGGFYDLGIVEDISYFGFVVNYVQNVLGGLKLINNSAVAVQSHRFNDWFNAGATFVTIEGDHQSIQINNNFFQPNSNENSLYLNPNLTTSGGSVVGNVFDLTNGGSIFQSGSKDQMDIYWTYAGNSNLADSTAIGDMFIEDSTTITTIITPDTYYKVNSTWNLSLSERFKFNDTGIWNYTGIEDIQVEVEAEIDVDPTTGGGTQWYSIIYKNGQPINSSRSNLGESNLGSVVNIKPKKIVEVETGDYFEIYIKRISGVGDAAIINGKFSVKKV
jgi:hypothetical protein